MYTDRFLCELGGIVLRLGLRFCYIKLIYKQFIIVNQDKHFITIVAKLVVHEEYYF